MKYIVLPHEIAEATDKNAIDRAVIFLRNWATDSDITERVACEQVEDGELTGKWEVWADDRGEKNNPFERVKIAGPFETEAGAEAEAMRLNEGVESWIKEYILNDYIDLPNVTIWYMSGVKDGMYPQSRRVEITAWVGDLAVEMDVFWSSREIGNRDLNTAEVARQVVADFPEALAKAQAAIIKE